MLPICAALVVAVAASFAGANRRATNLIIDTDIYSDVDDVGALVLGATLPDVNLLAVNINSQSSFSALAASAILAHYGRADVPIGIKRPLTNDTFFDSRSYSVGEYASKVAHGWSGGQLPWDEAEKAWEPVTLYRQVLSKADDGSVTIASIGFLDNLSALLDSTADTYSELTGRDLIKAKVSQLVIMGGAYPSGHSWNFWGSGPDIAAHVINTWNGRIVFVGSDVGKFVLSGKSLIEKASLSDPVRMAYIFYKYNQPHSSWDPLTVLFAVNGLALLFKYGNDHGYNHIEPNGTNRWVWDRQSSNQFFLRLNVDNETAAAELDRLYLDAATKFSTVETHQMLRPQADWEYPTLVNTILVLSAIALLIYCIFRRSSRPAYVPTAERVPNSKDLPMDEARSKSSK